MPCSIVASVLASLIGASPTPFQITYLPDFSSYGLSEEEVIANVYPADPAIAGAGGQIVHIVIAGGNSLFVSKLEEGEVPPLTPQAETEAQFGVTYVAANLPPWSIGTQDFMYSSEFLGRLVQHLRYNASQYNIDPNKITVTGRSGGGMKAAWACYHTDLIDEAGAGQYAVSSQPDACNVMSTLTDVNCYFPCQVPDVGIQAEDFLGVKDFSLLDSQTKSLFSPTDWLVDRQQFRTNTPPLLLIFDSNKLAWGDGDCGTILDVHDWPFGPIYEQAMLDYANSVVDSRLRATTRLIDQAEYAEDDDWAAAQAQWLIDRVNEQAEGLNVVVPHHATVNPDLGESQVIKIWGATANASLILTFGVIKSEMPLPLACWSSGITDAGYLASASADENGYAEVALSVNPTEIGVSFYIQAHDLTGCKSSEVMSMLALAPVGSSCGVGGSDCTDCNGNGQFDQTDVLTGLSNDSNGNGVPDECVVEGDCNSNLIGDLEEINLDPSADQNCNGILDECEGSCELPENLAIACASFSSSCMGLDCDGNGITDVLDLCSGVLQDCNGDGTWDDCPSQSLCSTPIP